MNQEEPTTNSPSYIAFGTPEKVEAARSVNSAISKYDVVRRATAGQLTNDQHIRSPFSRTDYDRWRPGERIPSRFRDVIQACRTAYLRLGIVRNVIDMMTDFATDDLKIIHPDKKQEAFLRVWMKKAKIKEVVEEFVRHFLIDGNIVLKRTTAKLTKPVEKQWRSQADGYGEIEKLYTEDKQNKGEIPWRYSFLNVAALEWIGGDIAASTGQKKLVFHLSSDFLKSVLTPHDPFQVTIINKMPVDIKDAIIKSKTGFVELDMSMLYIAYNKKDNWEDWAPPFLYSILSDIYFRDKLRQAEISALDGVINVIRLWKLGDHVNGFLPNQAVIDKLVNILETNTGGGSFDIVWDSMITLEEHYPPIDKILGSEKYEQVNRDILIGLGVPEVLIGGEGGNFSNSFIQLKTLVEKLQYVRERVTEWLDGELKMVCEAMQIVVPPKVKFNQMNLEDEEAARQLILGLLDRGVISVEAVLDVYGEDFLFEVERIKQQQTILKSANIKVKSPLDPKPVTAKPGGATAPPGGKTGKVGKGRPPGSKTVGPQTRKPKPRTSAYLSIFAFDAIAAIDEIIVPLYIEDANVSNARKLTMEQKDELNQVRMMILACISPDDNLSKESLLDVAANIASYNNEIVISMQNSIAAFIADRGVEPTLTQRKNIEAIAWAKFYDEQQEVQI